MKGPGRPDGGETGMSRPDPDPSIPAALEALHPGTRHVLRSEAGPWALLGRSLPGGISWLSVTPSALVTTVWGGGCEIFDAEGTTRVAPPDVLYMQAGHPHRGRGAPNASFITLFLDAPEVHVSRLTATQLLPRRPDIAEAVLAFIERLVDEEHVEAARQAEAVRALLPARSTRAAELPPNLRRAKEALDRDYATDVSIADLARMARVTPAQFSRRFAALWGVPPVQYRKQLRMQMAARLLSEGRSVTDAASESGFSNVAHFSRAFSAQFGVSPAAWQRGTVPERR